jgi:type II secretory pathway component GspD/PulD (secretin)
MRFKSAVIVMFALSAGLLAPSLGAESATATPDKGMNFKFEDVELTKALQTVSKATGLTVAIEMGLELDGRVDLTWNTVEWRDGLTRILDQVGLGWQEADGFIIVKQIP